jgi:hypothetical protein
MSSKGTKSVNRPDKSGKSAQAKTGRPGELIGQHVTSEAYEWAEFELQRGTLLTGDELANIVLNGPDQPLPHLLRRYLARFLRGEIRIPTPRGRKPRSDGWYDFTFEEVDRRYRMLCR